MSYAKPERIQYTLAAVTTTDAGATIATIKGPKGKAGRIAEINGYVTTTHVRGTTPTELRVGHGSGADLTAMAQWSVPAGTAPVVLSASGTTGALKPSFRLPADTDILVNTIQNATGSPAGVIVYSIAIDWF
jgi:hypothetical protein